MIKTTQKHLAIFIPNLKGGGAERVMLNIANWFSTNGYRVDLVLGQATGEYLSELAPEVRIINLHSSRMMTSLFPFIRYLRRERPASVLSALNHVNLVAIIARKIAGVRTRLVISERNSLSSLPRNWKGDVFRRLMRVMYPSADAIVAVTKDGVKELIDILEMSRDKILSIPNPIDLEQIKKLAAEPIDHPYFLQSSSPVIIAVGRLVPQKDFATLIKSFANIRKKRKVHLIILGEGELRSELEGLIKKLELDNDVFLPGFKNNPFKWIAKSDVFVLSSRFEGFPNVLVQALACGVSVVSTNCPTGPCEILDEGRLGRLVRVGDEAGLEEAIIHLLNNPKAIKEDLLVDKYSIDQIGHRYMQCLFPGS